MRFPKTRDAGPVAALVAAVLLCAGCPSDDDIDPNEPHALGVIAIGEAHASSGGTASASVAAQFVPDAAAMAPTCEVEVTAGCTIAARPDCGGTCGDDEVCSFDGACESVCTRICDADCDDGEECYFPTPDAPACRVRQNFDAGAIALSGTTTPVTLFPPYAFDGVDEGSLFLDGAELSVTAMGATGAGYDSFSDSFTATRLLRSQPALHELSLVDIFGSGDVPVQWLPGSDRIRIAATVTSTAGASRTITCEADDPSGRFDIPRAAIDAALDGETLDAMTIAITRSHSETQYGIATVGSIPGETVQPTGWLELTTSSTETASFTGCDDGQQLCGDECIDVNYDDNNCGECGNACASGDYCSAGTCSGATACNGCINEASTTGTCAALYDNCTNTPACADLRGCLNGCSTQDCVNQCFTDHDAGRDAYQSWANCICNNACTTECNDACF